MIDVRPLEGPGDSCSPDLMARRSHEINLAEQRELRQATEKAKVIHAAEWLVCLKADVVLLREDVQGKEPAFVLAYASAETRLTQTATVGEAIAEQIAGYRQRE
jgi:hypothetical protein